MQYARAKEDGFIFRRGLHMDAKTYDFFEYDGEDVPEFVQDLPAFLAGSKSDEVTARPKKKKDEPVFLKTADGSIAAV